MTRRAANPCLHRLALCALALLAALRASATASADVELIGRPVALEVQPSAVRLVGPRALQQLVISGKYADGSLRDLTRVGRLTADKGDVVSVGEDGLLAPRGTGTTTLTVAVGGQTARVPVTVEGLEDPAPVRFRHELIAALNVGGCNAGACHGTPVGKNGFKLSLRGFDPASDYLQLTRDVHGRRTVAHDPDSSLVYLKALAQVPHEGGQRFRADSAAAQTLRAWLAEGLRDDAGSVAEVKRLEIVPGSRVLRAPAREQQLAVLAHFSDGAVRDVTRLTVFSSSDNAVADVTPTGLVSFAQAGEVAILCRYLESLQPVRLTYLEPRPGFVWKNPPAHNEIDKHVFAKLKMLSIEPSGLCTDEELVRRVYLDLCAVLPTPDEVRTFLADKAPDRRAKLIDRLLQRPEFADFWAMKWLDVLRATSRSLGPKGVVVYRDWLRDHLHKNTPFDKVVRELLTATGNTYESGPANYFRASREPGELAEVTAQVFLGVRVQCAKCHNHPYEKWSQDDYNSLAAFFARVTVKTASGKKANPKKPEAEIVSFDQRGEVKHPVTGKAVAPRFLGGAAPELAKDADRREALATWLTAAHNPFFAKSVVNRVWYHLLGRGIVDAPDDFRESNPPANDELLDALARDFVAGKFDLKRLVRTIANSRTYQLSVVSNATNRTDTRYFSRTMPRMLTAEQMLDAICQATEVPENFAGLPKGTRAVQVPDTDEPHNFMKVFTRPARDLPCECERDGSPSLAQALNLINGSTVQSRLSNEKNRIGRLLASKLGDAEILSELYLATLSRPPREREARAALAFVAGEPDRRKAWEDVQWALFNMKEFMYRH